MDESIQQLNQWIQMSQSVQKADRDSGKSSSSSLRHVLDPFLS